MMLLKMSISGGILIMLIIILRFLAINRLPKRVFVLLWNIVLLRLLIPFDLPLHYGIASPAIKIMDDGIELYNASNNLIMQGNSGEVIAETANTTLRSITWATIVWLAGTIALLVIFGVLYFREYRKIQSALPVTKETEDYLKSVATIPKRTKLLVSDRISTPLTFGIVSPKIVFPKIWKPSDNEEIKYVLTHETIHIKRFDNLWKVIMLAAVSIHWFNPLVWIMYLLFNRDIELSCDEKVIALLGETTKKKYAMALINLAEKQYHWSFFSNGFGKNAIQERIVAIMKFKKATYISVGCAVLLLAGAITVFATSPDFTGVQKMSDAEMTEIALQRLEENYPNVAEWVRECYPDTVWWTYEGYKQMMDVEHEELESMIGEYIGNTPSTGNITVTSEMIEQQMRDYEETLEELQNGWMVSKSIGGDENLGGSFNPADIEAGTGNRELLCSVLLKDGTEKVFGPYQTAGEMLSEIIPFCEAQVSVGNMEQDEMDELINKYSNISE